MKKIKLLLVVLIGIMSINGSKPKGVVIDDRPLTWKDFRGRPNSKYAKALTFTTMGYSSRIQNGKYVYDVTCLFIPKKSWVAKDIVKGKDKELSAYILKHEQVHYDISRVIAMELDATMNNFDYDGNRQQYQADSIFRSLNQKQRKIQSLYDDESNHSINVKAQVKWNTIVDKALKNKKIDVPSD